MKLFLTSAASLTLDKLTPLLPKYPSEMTVAFIPTAAMGEPAPWMDLDRNKLQAMGFYVFDVDLNGMKEVTLRKELSGVDIIFVAGGNTFYLLEHAQKSGFNTLVKELVKNDVIYIGSSAGSVLAGPNIEMVDQFDDKTVAKLASFDGLGLVDFVVLPHYAPDKKEYKRVIKENEGKYKIIPLADNQAISIIDQSREIVEV